MLRYVENTEVIVSQHDFIKGKFCLKNCVTFCAGITVLVNGSMSKWRAVTSDSPQGSVLGLMTFNIFFGDLDGGISAPSDKFPDCIRL